ncbi:HmuY family protein [Myxococcus landrumensis]|uniref:HmuY family protein n=1 Tax=Myxococcus landrumensis TaxID=2813577 RepID=A0ABX7N2Q8_9BACT|nr:HmuY family protein [Myxococcus landrumus]QSQ12778.1 HmuY family protein [Myxococcus landrumus]
MMSQTEQVLPRRAGQHGLWVLVAVAMSLALMASCGDDEPKNHPEPDAGSQPDAGSKTCDPSQVRCSEQTIDKLSLLTVVSTGPVREEGTTTGEFVTNIDSRAGGLQPTMSYTYLRFTPTGLAQVQIHDQAALSSTEWDIAVRRYTVRVNSGTSGPSCVSVATLPQGTTFASVSAVSSAWSFQSERWFDDACTLIPDNSGLNGPATVLGGFWTYQSCVAMTGQVFAVRLADGRHVKLEVTGYYEPSAQQVCNQTGSVPQPSGSGQLRIKWAFLP